VARDPPVLTSVQLDHKGRVFTQWTS
jgi:hypothetical protein